MAPVDPDAKIPCATPQQLQLELESLSDILSLGEKETTWEKMEKALIRFAGVTRGGGYKHLTMYVEGVGRKGSGLQIIACMMSDRGRLSGVATELLQTLAPRLGVNFAPLVTVYLDPLVTLLGRPNKVFLKRAEKCLATIISHCHLLSILSPLRKGLNDEAGTCRRGCAVGFQRIIDEWDRDVLGEKGVVILEDALRKMATDKDAEVRKIGKAIWGRYSDIWPERVDDFSAPLTPTIRRYLDIPANGMPAKPKPRAAPVVPKVSAPPSLNSSTKSAPSPPRPANPRVQALGGKQIRLPPMHPAPVVREPEVEKPIAGPSRRQISPRKAMNLLPRPPPPIHADTEPIRLAKSTSTANLRGEAAVPFKIGHHGRSASHAILPSVPSTSSLTSLTDIANPLSKPVRPMLPPSFSSLSLPPDPMDVLVGPKRVPSSHRLPVLPQTPAFGEEDGGQIFVTPTGPLRGAARLPNQMMQARKMMGQAQRVVQPNPPPTDTQPMLGAATPAAPRTVSRSVRDRIQDLEKASTPTKVEPATIPLPASPTVSKPFTPPRMLGGDLLPTDVMVVIASPMMPVLSQSTRSAHQDEEELSSTDLLKVDMGEGLADRTVIQPVAPVPDDSADEQVAEICVPTVNDLEASIANVGSPTESTAVPVEVANEFPAPSAASALEMIQPEAVEVNHVYEGLNPQKDESAPPAKPTKAPTALSSSVSAKPAPATKAAKVSTKPNGKPDVQLPSVAARLPSRRVVTAPERKPFKPTSQTAKASTLTAPTAATAARAVSAKVSTKPEDVVRPASKASESSKLVAAAAAPAPAPKPAAPRVISGSFAAPTKASASRNTASAAAAPTAPPAKVAPKVALPPVKKEKVRLKPALPRFVPTRGGARAASDSSIKLAESTSTASTTSTADRKPGVIRAKVKPEMVALPASPLDAKKDPEGISNSPTTYTFKEGVVARVKVKPETVPLPASPVPAATVPLPESPVVASTPLAEHIPLPSSPLAATSALPLADSPVAATSAHSNALGLPMAPSHTAWTGAPHQTPISKASTAATMAAFDTDTDESDDDTEGVTFKYSADRARTMVPPRPQPQAEMVGGDLMEFSAPSRSIKSANSENAVEVGREGGKKQSTTPKSSPSRHALRIRDANTPRSKGEEVY